MKYATTGIDTLKTEVIDISPQGIWLLTAGKEYFLAYDEFPWFRKAAVETVFNVIKEGKDHLRWPDLDVDLSIESIQTPGVAPLVYEPKEPYGSSQ